jgi:uncharacterized protein YbjT (DUF2867 family)
VRSGCILVTGASGKLGQAVVEELVAHDYDVVGADRRPGLPAVWGGGAKGRRGEPKVQSSRSSWDRPGMGVDFKVEAAQAYLAEEDKGFFV